MDWLRENHLNSCGRALYAPSRAYVQLTGWHCHEDHPHLLSSQCQDAEQARQALSPPSGPSCLQTSSTIQSSSHSTPSASPQAQYPLVSPALTPLFSRLGMPFPTGLLRDFLFPQTQASDLARSLLGIYLKELKEGTWRDICTPMSTAVLFTKNKR